MREWDREGGKKVEKASSGGQEERADEIYATKCEEIKDEACEGLKGFAKEHVTIFAGEKVVQVQPTILS